MIAKLVAALLALIPVMSVAGPDVLYEHGGPTRFSLGEPVRVTSTLLQIRLAEDLVLSASTGAEFALEPLAGDAYRLRILAAPAQLVDLSANAITHLVPGTYRLKLAPSRVRLTDDGSGALRAEHGFGPLGTAYAQGYLLGDYVMVSQDDYLAVNVGTVNSFLSSLLRNLGVRNR
ncbi:MAG: hypothetical protein HZC24_00805 [Rhodocyclales bacterium]|nr:hypothetical protein [Rhodocyclales bacterium]